MSNVVFVGNVPYQMSEEQLIEVFKSVGQVTGFRLVFDRDTGKAKGYGFCEFADHETALSAVRNLNNADVGGRSLRIDLAEKDPLLEGKTTVRGELLDGSHNEPRSGWRNNPLRSENSFNPLAFLENLPSGKPLHNMSSLDAISETLAAMPNAQMMEILAQMKSFIITHPEPARILLQKQPQLSYALFQALVMHNIVPAEVVLKMRGGTEAPPPRGGPPPPGPRGAPHMQHQQPSPYPQHNMPPFPPGPSPVPGMGQPLPGYAQGPPGGYYNRGPPPPQAHQLGPPPSSASTVSSQPPSTPTTAAAVAATAGIDETQRDMIMQILTMSQETVNTLPEAQRISIQALRNQFLGAQAAS